MTDFISLRTLLLTDAESTAAVIRQGAGMASLPVELTSVTEPAKAARQLGMGDIDLVIIDESLPAEGRIAVVQAAKKAKRVPVTLLLMDRPGAPGDMADGMPDAVLDKTASAQAVAKALSGCSRLRVPSRALVVDDSSTMRSIVRKILSGSRFPIDVSEAEEGLAALRELGSGNFDFVMLDYNMPGLNGVETLSEIKRISPRIEVVMITSTPDDDIAQKARAAGAAAFLKKPFYPADIDTVLLRMCGVRPVPA